MRRSIALSLTGIALLLGLTACASAPGSGAASEPEQELTEETILLDVRTAEEYAAGHLDGAQLLDFNSGDVEAAIPGLDPNAEYLVYCRSGNRSGQAITLLQEAGFTDLTNLGSLEQAADSTGLPIVN